MADAMKVLIDAYNLLHALGRMRYLDHPAALANQRRWLAQQIAGLVQDADLAVVLIFDCRNPSQHLPTRSSVRGIEMVFVSQAGQAADEVIQELLRQSSQPNHTLVVSDDRGIVQMARRYRAAWLNCGDFWDLLHGRLAAEAWNNLPPWAQQRMASLRGGTRFPVGPAPTSERPDETPEREKPPAASAQENEQWLAAFGHLDCDPSLGQPDLPFLDLQDEDLLD
jgi:predicted RNA-binding protein with PIN domain